MNAINIKKWSKEKYHFLFFIILLINPIMLEVNPLNMTKAVTGIRKNPPIIAITPPLEITEIVAFNKK